MTEVSIEINIEEAKWMKDLAGAEEIIKEAAIAALNEAGITGQANNIEVSILLTNDNFMKRLNRDYRNKDKSTNVLSFPLEDFIAGEYENVSGDVAIGDIIFALETIATEALEQSKSLESHLTHLAVHGILHLLGYDHEDDAEAETMEALEIKVLSGLKIDNPYQS